MGRRFAPTHLAKPITVDDLLAEMGFASARPILRYYALRYARAVSRAPTRSRSPVTPCISAQCSQQK
jgi:hypothetical protein